MIIVLPVLALVVIGTHCRGRSKAKLAGNQATNATTKFSGFMWYKWAYSPTHRNHKPSTQHSEKAKNIYSETHSPNGNSC